MRIFRHILGGRTGEAARYDIGLSCYLLIVTIYGRTWRFIVDCGLEPTNYGGRGINLKLLEEILNGEKIDAVFITHAHLDHCGFLPALVLFFADHCKVYATTTTAALLPHVFTNTLTLSQRKSGVLAAHPFTWWELTEVIYGSRLEIVRKPGVIKLAKGIEVLVWPAGHINGAASFIFRFTEGSVVRKVAFFGDYSVHHQILVQGAPILPPEWFLTGDHDAIASMDCTNGGDDLPPWKETLDEMHDISEQVVEQGGKWVTVTFSIVRWQLLIHEALRRMELKDKVGKVYGDGPSAQEIARILKGNPWWGDEAFDLSGATMIGRNTSREEIIGSLNGARIYTPSGMGHGPATEYEVALLDDPNSYFAFTGYAARGTNARAILDAKDGDEIEIQQDMGEGENPRVKVRASRKQFRLTGHQLRSDALWRVLEILGCFSRDDIKWRKGGDLGHPKEWLTDRALRRLKNVHVGLTHANTAAFDWFEGEFAGMVETSRADKPEDRNREI